MNGIQLFRTHNRIQTVYTVHKVQGDELLMGSMEPFCTTLANAKGGVGRTTLAVNIADRIADRDLDVLLVDTTDQDGIRTALGIESADGNGDLGTVLRAEGSLTDAIVSDGTVDVIPPPADPMTLRSALTDKLDALILLASRVIAPARSIYDHVLIDTPPAISPISDAALVAADRVVLPTGLNEADLHVLARTIEKQIVPIRRERPLPITAIVPNRLRGTAEEQRLLTELTTSGLGPFILTADGDPVTIRERTAVQESWAAGIPYTRYESSTGMVDRFEQIGNAVLEGNIDA